MFMRSWLECIRRRVANHVRDRTHGRRPSPVRIASIVERLDSRKLLSVTPVGPETQVNTFTTNGQTKAAVASDSAGDYVVVWQSFGENASSYGIYGQLYAASGARRGGEFQIDTATNGANSFPAVAMDSAGDFVVTWQGNTDGSSGHYEVYARRYNSSGVPQSGQFEVNTFNNGGQTRPAVALDQTGDFVVTWLSFSQYNSQPPNEFAMYFQRYNASGVAQGGETLAGYAENVGGVFTATPSIGSDATGNFVIDLGSQAQRYSASGASLGSVDLSSVSDGYLAMDLSGDFVVTSDSGTQMFNAAGVPQGSLLPLGGESAKAAMDNAGDFALTWQAADASGLGIYGQFVSSTGVAGNIVRVNTYTVGNQEQPAVGMDATGDFVVAWQSGNPASASFSQDGSGYGIFSQRYTTHPGPILANIESTALNTLAAVPTPVTQTIQFSSNVTTIADATVMISSNYQNGQDVLGFVNTPKISGSWNPTNGTLTLSGTDSVADYTAALRSVTYHDTSATPNTSLVRTISFQASDGTNEGNTESRNVNVLASAPTPTLSGISSSINYVQGASPIALAPNLVITDPNNLTQLSAMVSFTNWQGEDRLSFSNIYAFQHTFVQDLTAHTASLTIMGVATQGQYQTLLRSVVYWDVSSNPVTAARVAWFTVNDGATNSTPATQSITVTALHLPPLLSGIESSALSYNALGAATAITSTLLVSTAVVNDLTSATVQIQNYQNGQDVLMFQNTAKITGTFNGFTGVLTLTGVDTVSDYRTALRSVMFFNSDPYPVVGDRTINFQVNDGTASNNLSNVATRTIDVLPPMLSGVPSTPLSYSTAAAPLPIVPSIVVEPANSSILTQAVIQITGNYTMSQDRLSLVTSAGVTSNFDSTTGTLTLTGSATYAAYQSILRTLTYQNTSASPNKATRTVSITAKDAAGEASNPIVVNIGIV